MTIFYMALENIVKPNASARWVITFAFGLVHGFGFSFLLRESLQFAGSHLATSLVAFNIGVEIGQLIVLAVAIPVLHVLFKRGVAERVGTIILSALVAHTAWHWTIDRGTALWQAGWPRLDGPSLLILARWTAGAFVAISAVKLILQFRARQEANPA